MLPRLPHKGAPMLTSSTTRSRTASATGKGSDHFAARFPAERLAFAASVEGLPPAERERYVWSLLGRLMFLRFSGEAGLVVGVRPSPATNGDAFYRRALLPRIGALPCLGLHPLEQTSAAIRIPDEAFTRLF